MEQGNSFLLLTPIIDRSIQDALDENIPQLQNNLYKLYSHFNKPGGGRLITTYPLKQKLGECFIFMLQYDWMHDEDIREVWAEDGFYCLVKAMQTKDPMNKNKQEECMWELLTLLFWGGKSLLNKIKDILTKAQIRNESVFSNKDYSKGAQYVLDQFGFMAAFGARPLLINNPGIFNYFAKTYDGFESFFDHILSYKDEFFELDPIDVFAKARFCSDIIGNIINEV